jgi:hypothetical protein
VLNVVESLSNKESIFIKSAKLDQKAIQDLSIRRLESLDFIFQFRTNNPIINGQLGSPKSFIYSKIMKNLLKFSR